MKKNGVYFGKMIPCHRGHLYQIISASTQCEKLYVVISDNKETTRRLCEEAEIPVITYQLRKQWLSQQLQDINHIEIRVLDESDLPPYPNGWSEWTQRMQGVIDAHIDVFFVGEEEYKLNLPKYFPDSEVVVLDPDRNRYPISATEVRNDPMKHWDYILGSARPFFTKKVLIAGTESCGKTTLTRYLSKLYNTSWSEEVGRYYAKDYLGGDETIFTDNDFKRIAHLQSEQDYHALRAANKVCFFDTDATITNYYSELYLGHRNPGVESYINPNNYDVILYLKPDVIWVADGMRLNGDQEKRELLDDKLYNMFEEFGFKNIITVSGGYTERLTKSIEVIDNLIKIKGE